MKTNTKHFNFFFFQPSWTDSSGQELSRDQFIMALHQVEALLIRATYNTRMLQTTYDIKLVLIN